MPLVPNSGAGAGFPNRVHPVVDVAFLTPKRIDGTATPAPLPYRTDVIAPHDLDIRTLAGALARPLTVCSARLAMSWRSEQIAI
jgi:hypothetical protein